MNPRARGRGPRWGLVSCVVGGKSRIEFCEAFRAWRRGPADLHPRRWCFPFGVKSHGTQAIQRVEFGLVPEAGMMHKAEVLIEVWVRPGQERVVVKQGENIIDESAISPQLIIKAADCFEGSGNNDCTFIGVSNIVFREEPFFEVIGLKVADITGRASTVYLNDGFDIVGESMNPPKTDVMDSGKRGVGLIDVTQIDKWNNIWIDEKGIEYFKNSFGTYIRQTPITQEIIQDDSWTVMNRMNSNFEKMINYEAIRAKQIFDSSQIISESPGSFAYEEQNYLDRFLDEDFVRDMKYEADLATQYWDSKEIQGKLRPAFTHVYPEN